MNGRTPHCDEEIGRGTSMETGAEKIVPHRLVGREQVGVLPFLGIKEQRSFRKSPFDSICTTRRTSKNDHSRNSERALTAFFHDACPQLCSATQRTSFVINQKKCESVNVQLVLCVKFVGQNENCSGQTHP